MDYLNPMFRKQLNSNTKRITNSETTKNRKKRLDSKHDIKIPLPVKERQFIRRLARINEMSMTGYCSELIERALYSDNEYPYINYSSGEKQVVHAKLRASEYKKVAEYAITWDCSIRCAAHRILMAILEKEKSVIYV